MALLDERALRFLTREHFKASGARVRERRRALSMTQTTLADLAGITQGAVSVIELGEQDPRLHVKVAIAAALGCAVDDLFPNPDRERLAAIAAAARAA